MRRLFILLPLFAAIALGIAWFLPGEPTQASKDQPALRNDEPDVRPLRFAITAAFVSENGVDVYKDIVAYVQDKLGQPCLLVNGLSYRTVDAMLESGAIDVAFICGLPYVNKTERADPPIQLLAAPIMSASHYEDQPKYYSYVIVNRNSRYDSFESLRGCVFAYNDKLSNSGYNMPRFHLISIHETNGFFGTLKRSGSHEASIRMVANGEADASCVDSLVLDFDQQRGEPGSLGVKIIDRLGPAGIPPVVVSSSLNPKLKDDLARILTTMHEHDRGRAILERGLLKRFSAVDDSNYDDVRRMKTVAEQAGFTTLR